MRNKTRGSKDLKCIVKQDILGVRIRSIRQMMGKEVCEGKGGVRSREMMAVG